MAAPTIVSVYEPNLSVKVSGSNVDVAPVDITLSYPQANLSKGFSIINGTLVACTIVVLAANDDDNLVDVTEDFFGSGVVTLASDMMYLADVVTAVKKIIVRITPTSATNEVDVAIFAAKRS